MKKFMIGAIILGFATLAYPQNSIGGPEQKVKLENVTMFPVNSDYMHKVKEGTVSPRVLNLQNTVAHFNLLTSSIFEGSGKNYEISFGKTNGKIYATFNGKGKILHSYGWFKDIIFPIPVRNFIYRTHPGWYVLGNSYKVSYSKEGDVEKIYKVKIGNGHLQKRLKIDAEGNLL